jgi:hypothetical protein
MSREEHWCLPRAEGVARHRELDVHQIEGEARTRGESTVAVGRRTINLGAVVGDGPYSRAFFHGIGLATPSGQRDLSGGELCKKVTVWSGWMSVERSRGGA